MSNNRTLTSLINDANNFSCRVVILFSMILVPITAANMADAATASAEISGHAATPQSTPSATTPVSPEQERLYLIQVLQKRIPGTNPNDWVVGGGAFEPGVQATPLNADNATNSADILAIGKKLWDRKFVDGKSLANCFPNGGKRVAAAYPQFDTATKQVVTFEFAINRCLQLHGEVPIDYANAAVIGPLSAYGKSLADGQKLAVRVAGQGARDRYEAGRRWFQQRIGQKDFACASCHVLRAGEQFERAGLAPAVGQAVTWPRIQPGGSIRTLQAQFQRCMLRSGAEPFAVGSDEFNNLEYYLAYMSNGLPLKPLAITTSAAAPTATALTTTPK